MENHKSKLYNFIIIMVFLTFIGFFGIAYIIVPDREYSELENRYLTTFPELSWERLMSGEFMSDFDSYTADQIYGKDLFVKGNLPLRTSEASLGDKIELKCEVLEVRAKNILRFVTITSNVKILTRHMLYLIVTKVWVYM